VPTSTPASSTTLSVQLPWALIPSRADSGVSGRKLPARSALGADGLALGAKVEMECKAYAPAG